MRRSLRRQRPIAPIVRILGTSFIAVVLVFSADLQCQEVPVSESKKLHELFASEWDYQLEQHPTWASRLGDRRWNDRWENRSLDSINRQHSHNIEVLAKLKAIDRTTLSPSDQLNYDLFSKDYENEIEGHLYRWYLIPINQLWGVQNMDDLADALPFERLKDYDDWLARLRAFPTYIEQTIVLMREGIKQRIILPKIVLDRIPAQIDHQIVSDPKESPFYKPFMQFAGSIADADRSRLAVTATDVIKSDVVPSFRRFKEFFAKEYRPAAPDQVGIWQLPQGEELYRFHTRRHTTTNMPPREIHEIGQNEIRRIRGEMQAIIDKLGYKGSLAEFAVFLRSDPQFYYETREELLAAYRALTRRIDPMEPPDLWERYIAPEFRPNAPRGRTSENVRDLGLIFPNASPAALRTRGTPHTGHNYDKNQGIYRDHAARGWTGEVQLEAMNTEGIDVAVLFPTRGLGVLTYPDHDPRFAAALARAYNDWLHEPRYPVVFRTI